jgi:restriction system protein
MAVPTFQDLFWPSLLALKEGKELTLNEIFESSAKTLNLTKEDIDSKMKTTGIGRARYRTNWAMTYLTKAGLVNRVKRGTYQITNEGRELLKRDLKSIDANYLKENYPAFREWIKLSRKVNNGEVEAPGPEPGNGTPLEIIEANIDIIDQLLGQQLLDQILAKDPAFFEYVVKQLLQAMGYGEGSVTGQSGDEGIDGFINEDALGLETIYYQAKRYAPSTQVPQSMIRDFIGTLQMHGKDKGVFITTSSLPKGVGNIAEKSHKKVVFIDGERLVHLMIDYNVGVRTSRKVEIKAIDQDFFDVDSL